VKFWEAPNYHQPTEITEIKVCRKIALDFRSFCLVLPYVGVRKISPNYDGENMANILVVDDEVTFLKIIGENLVNENHNVFIAKDGAEALRLCDSQTFDLIVTDIWMPNIDGIDFILELNKRNSTTPIIAMSGSRYASNFNLQSATALGVCATLEKPFSGVHFLNAVDRALNKNSSR
jgi:DNA-binding NtrC family response regulator